MKNYKTWKILFPLLVNLPGIVHADQNLQKSVFQAVQTGSTNDLEMTIGEGALYRAIKTKKAPHDSLLHLAVKRRDIAMVEALLDYKAKHSLENDRGWTPLDYAVEQEDNFLVKLLVIRGAKIDHVSSKSPTNYEESPLVRAVIMGHYESLRLMLKFTTKEVNQNVLNAALFRLPSPSMQGKKMLKLLLHHGAELESKNHRGESVLNSYSFAILTPNYTKELLAHGARLESKDKTGATALMNAVSHDKRQKIQDLVESGASLYTVNHKGQNLLHIATDKMYDGNLSHIIEYYEKRNMTHKVINKPDAFGNTPLHYAAKQGSIQNIQLLIEKGARVRVHNLALKKPWDLLAEYEKKAERNEEEAQVLEDFRLASRNIFQKWKEDTPKKDSDKK